MTVQVVGVLIVLQIAWGFVGPRHRSCTVLPRFPRAPIEMPSRTAERLLFESLEATATEHITAEDFGRKAAKEALQATLKFLHDRGLSGQALKILADVFQALEDVDRGILPELFDPNASKRTGAEGKRTWSRATAALQTQIYAAACLGALMLKEMPKNKAAAKVARAAQNWPRFSKGIVKASTVINWRDYLLQSGSKDPARLAYDGLIRMFTECPRADELFTGILRDGPPLTGAKRKPKT